MPVSPGDGEALARRVSELYAEAELSLLRRIAKALAAGVDAPGWATAKLAELSLLRAQMGADLTVLDRAAGEQVLATITEAFQNGQALAVADLDDAGLEVVMPTARHAAIRQLAAETLGVVHAVRPAALRAVVDIYQRVVADAAATVIAGATTRRGAAQAALDRFAGQGVKGFKDKAGRNWGMESYVEMAVRTGTGNAAVQGHVDMLAVNGLDLVIVSDAPRECPLCKPWEGKILSVGGKTAGAINTASVTGDGSVKVTVAGSLAKARAAGLMHPNCRHSVSAYLPGATTAPKVTADRPGGYADQQRQRELERGIRKWKLRQSLALDDGARATADGKVKEWQKALREHLAASPDLKRQSAREQIGKAR